MSNEWYFINNDIIEHISGFRIELVAGSWHDPHRLNPVIPADMNFIEIATLLRKGIDFADKQQAEGLLQNQAKAYV